MFRIARLCLSTGSCSETSLGTALPCRALWTSSVCQHAEPAVSDQPIEASTSPAHALGAIRTTWTCVCISAALPDRNSYFTTGFIDCLAGCFSAKKFHENWLCRREEVHQVYDTPLLELVFRAATVHRMHNDPRMVSQAACSIGNL